MGNFEEFEKLHQSFFPNDDVDEYLELPTVCFRTDPIEALNHYEAIKSEIMYQSMQEETDMCMSFGVTGAVIAKYGFKGDRETVLKKLKAQIEFRKVVFYLEKDRLELLAFSIRHAEHYEKTEKLNPFLVQKRLLWSNYVQSLNDGKESMPYQDLLDRTEKLENAFWTNRRMMHQKRECYCFTNIDPLNHKTDAIL